MDKTAHYTKLAANMSPAARLGFMQGFAASIVPPDEVFQKVASKTGINAAIVKQAYINKVALSPLQAVGLGVGGGFLLPEAWHGIKRLLYGYRQPDERKTPFHEDIRNQAMYNQQLSRDLQGVRGAFAPSESPFGKTGSLNKEAFWPALAMGAGAMAAAPHLWNAAKGAWHGLWGTGGQGQGQGYQMPNQQLTPFHRDLRNMTMYNQMLSRDLQGVRGAFAPAANPFGGPSGSSY
jgi:hypothetical protein